MLNKDDGVFLPSIEGVVSGKTSQVVGMNEILNKLIGNDNYLDKRKMSTENTIEDLKNSKKYKLGDVVEVLGFYAKGDGSHHKRIAKDKDDGSGEQGQNGIWWCIVHSGDVNVSWFGAKGDGVADDTSIFNKAINSLANCVIIDKDLYLSSKTDDKRIININDNKENLTIMSNIWATINITIADRYDCIFGGGYGLKNVIIKNFNIDQKGVQYSPITNIGTAYSRSVIRSLGGPTSNVVVNSINVIDFIGIWFSANFNNKFVCKNSNIRYSDYKTTYDRTTFYIGSIETDILSNTVYYDRTEATFNGLITFCENHGYQKVIKIDSNNVYGALNFIIAGNEISTYNLTKKTETIISNNRVENGVSFIVASSTNQEVLHSLSSFNNTIIKYREFISSFTYFRTTGIFRFDYINSVGDYFEVQEDGFTYAYIVSLERGENSTLNINNINITNLKAKGKIKQLIGTKNASTTIHNIEKIEFINCDFTEAEHHFGELFVEQPVGVKLSNIFFKNCLFTNIGHSTPSSFSNLKNSKIYVYDCKMFKMFVGFLKNLEITSEINIVKTNPETSDFIYLYDFSIGDTKNVSLNVYNGFGNWNKKGDSIVFNSSIQALKDGRYTKGSTVFFNNKLNYLTQDLCYATKTYADLPFNKRDLFIVNNNGVYVCEIDNKTTQDTTDCFYLGRYMGAVLTGILELDAPYYTLKMQQEGIYEDYVAYRDELHEYENSQTTDDTMLLPVLQEPIIPESVREFAEKYKLI